MQGIPNGFYLAEVCDVNSSNAANLFMNSQAKSEQLVNNLAQENNSFFEDQESRIQNGGSYIFGTSPGLKSSGGGTASSSDIQITEGDLSQFQSWSSGIQSTTNSVLQTMQQTLSTVPQSLSQMLNLGNNIVQLGQMIAGWIANSY